MSNLVKGIENRTETIIFRNNTVKREKGERERARNRERKREKAWKSIRFPNILVIWLTIVKDKLHTWHNQYRILKLSRRNKLPHPSHCRVWSQWVCPFSLRFTSWSSQICLAPLPLALSPRPLQDSVRLFMQLNQDANFSQRCKTQRSPGESGQQDRLCW